MGGPPSFTLPYRTGERGHDHLGKRTLRVVGLRDGDGDAWPRLAVDDAQGWRTSRIYDVGAGHDPPGRLGGSLAGPGQRGVRLRYSPAVKAAGGGEERDLASGVRGSPAAGFAFPIPSAPNEETRQGSYRRKGLAGALPTRWQGNDPEQQGETEARSRATSGIEKAVTTTPPATRA